MPCQQGVEPFGATPTVDVTVTWSCTSCQCYGYLFATNPQAGEGKRQQMERDADTILDGSLKSNLQRNAQFYLPKAAQFHTSPLLRYAETYFSINLFLIKLVLLWHVKIQTSYICSKMAFCRTLQSRKSEHVSALNSRIPWPTLSLHYSMKRHSQAKSEAGNRTKASKKGWAYVADLCLQGLWKDAFLNAEGTPV